MRTRCVAAIVNMACWPLVVLIDVVSEIVDDILADIGEEGSE
ncbi:MAG: hypothetical protein ACREHG_10725 [Candidatus Saccharimonadales bacterium]